MSDNLPMRGWLQLPIPVSHFQRTSSRWRKESSGANTEYSQGMIGAVCAGRCGWKVWEDVERRTRTLNGETAGVGERDQRVTEEAWRGMPLLAPLPTTPSFSSFLLSPSVGMAGGWANFE